MKMFKLLIACLVLQMSTSRVMGMSWFWGTSGASSVAQAASSGDLPASPDGLPASEEAQAALLRAQEDGVFELVEEDGASISMGVLEQGVLLEKCRRLDIEREHLEYLLERAHPAYSGMGHVVEESVQRTSEEKKNVEWVAKYFTEVLRMPDGDYNFIPQPQERNFLSECEQPSALYEQRVKTRAIARIREVANALGNQQSGIYGARQKLGERLFEEIRELLALLFDSVQHRRITSKPGPITDQIRMGAKHLVEGQVYTFIKTVLIRYFPQHGDVINKHFGKSAAPVPA